jgi:hypothetical protein
MNTEQKHTPGPWHVDYAQGIIAADGTVVAYVESDHSDTPTPDGNLIAAAPDLLEAAKQALQVFVDQRWDDDLSAAKSLKAAIAKAEGKA